MARTEIIYIVAAIVILGTVTTVFQDILFESDNYEIEENYQKMAFYLLDKFIDSVALKSFDEVSIASIPVEVPGSFTSPLKLGPETNEIYPNFDDIDDYFNFSLTDTFQNGKRYTIKVDLGYVTMDDEEIYLATRTRRKRIDVTLISPSLPESVCLSRIFSFYRIE